MTATRMRSSLRMLQACRGRQRQPLRSVQAQMRPLPAELRAGAAHGGPRRADARGRARAQALRPTLFIGVPRVFDKVYAGVQERLAERTVIARVLFRLAFFFKQRALLRGALWDTVRAAPTLRAHRAGGLPVERAWCCAVACLAPEGRASTWRAQCGVQVAHFGARWAAAARCLQPGWRRRFLMPLLDCMRCISARRRSAAVCQGKRVCAHMRTLARGRHVRWRIRWSSTRSRTSWVAARG